MKGQRHAKIREIITNQEIETQDELVQSLCDAGFRVTQATVSRDIKEMYLIKVPLEDGRYQYAMPTDQRQNPIQRLKRTLSDHFLSIDYTDHLVVMKCLPGSAGTICALIDQLDWHEIMGTIGGDDTLLIICRTPEQSRSCVDQLMTLLT